MLETEFIRSLQSNYERVRLDNQPDEQRYQYCILTRGGIRGLLTCSLRYINGEAYLYYDITSRQNVAQLYDKQTIDRAWVQDFFWSYEQITGELGRFLLDEKNILLYPDQIFEDLGSRNFFFLYLPYHQEGNGFGKFLEFLMERMDYDDTELVECVYFIYEQYEKYGDIYLQDQIFADVKRIENVISRDGSESEEDGSEDYIEESVLLSDLGEPQLQVDQVSVKKGLLEKLGFKKKMMNKQKNAYREMIYPDMAGMVVAEEVDYNEEYDEEDYGRTIYVEQKTEDAGVHKLYTPDGRVVATLDKDVFVVGKQKGEADLTLEDDTVSRLHARICKESDMVYLEDLNSTNGSFKNGLRLQPYEKRRLEEGDEVRFGKLLFVYR